MAGACAVWMEPTPRSGYASLVSFGRRTLEGAGGRGNGCAAPTGSRHDHGERRVGHHDNRLAAKLLSRLKLGSMLLADRGYDADWIRTLVRQHGAWANIPPKSNRKEALSFNPYLYRARNLVERFFNKIKHCRRVATRYDKLAANYLAFIQLASIRLWLRINESTTLALLWQIFERQTEQNRHCTTGRSDGLAPLRGGSAWAAGPNPLLGLIRPH
jgi:transposase